MDLTCNRLLIFNCVLGVDFYHYLGYRACGHERTFHNGMLKRENFRTFRRSVQESLVRKFRLFIYLLSRGAWKIVALLRGIFRLADVSIDIDNLLYALDCGTFLGVVSESEWRQSRDFNLYLLTFEHVADRAVAGLFLIVDWNWDLGRIRSMWRFSLFMRCRVGYFGLWKGVQLLSHSFVEDSWRSCCIIHLFELLFTR